MAEYQASVYNLCYDDNGSEYPWILANTYTGCIMVADAELKELVMSFEPGTYDRVAARDPALHEYLVDKGFVVRAGLDEVKRLRVRFMKAKYDPRNLYLTILPTTGCNLACVYCYEQQKSQGMTPEVVQATEALVEGHLDSVRSLGVTWYGGEPLLMPQMIEQLSRSFVRRCEEKGIAYVARMVTNGTLLDSGTVDLLVACHIRRLQVTIDGPREVHDARRFYRRGRAPSFDDIIEGLANCKGKIPVGVRINIDWTNLDGYERLVEFLEGEGLLGGESGNFVSLGMVKPWTDGVGTCGRELLSFVEFGQLVDRFQDYLEQRNLIQVTTEGLAPSAPCGAVNLYNYLVCPDGTLKKCWIHPTLDGVRVGDVQQGLDLSLPTTVDWLGYDPTLDPACAACALLPACAGGCPYEMMARPEVKDEYCEYEWRAAERNVRRAVGAAKRERRST
jgi:uncharacterized protein